MNEDSLKIIANQKKDIEKLNEYVDAGFKIICDLGKKDRKSIKFLSFCIGFMTVVVYKQNSRIKNLELQIKELKNKDVTENKTEEVAVE